MQIAKTRNTFLGILISLLGIGRTPAQPAPERARPVSLYNQIYFKRARCYHPRPSKGQGVVCVCFLFGI